MTMDLGFRKRKSCAFAALLAFAATQVQAFDITTRLRPVSDVDAPRDIRSGLRLIFTQLIWIFPLVAIERFFDDHISHGVVLLALTFSALIISVYWEKLLDPSVQMGVKMILAALVVSVILLLFVIWRLLSGPTFALKVSGDAAPDAVRTSLKLQFYGDHRIPTAVGAPENIYN